MTDNPASMQERAWILQLAREFQEITRYYAVPLPLPFFRISSNQQHYGSWHELTRTLSLSRALIEEQSWDVVIEILKHEMAHLWVTEHRGHEAEAAHGPFFQEACRRLGVASWARTASVEINPDTARHQHRSLGDEQERQLRRIEKLLSLAESSNPHEASLAMEKARALCQQYQLENIQSRGDRSHGYTIINHSKKTMPAHQSAIASILCTHFYVDCVARSQYDAASLQEYKVLEILGSIENVRMAEYVYWFLWNQLPLLWDSYRSSKRAGRASQRSFYLGVLNGLHEKLAEQKSKAHTSPQVWALTTDETRALERSVQRALQAFVKERYPRLHRGSGRRSGIERDAYASGQNRGRELEIRKGIARSRQSVLALAAGKGN